MAVIGIFAMLALVMFFANIIWKFLCLFRGSNLLSEASHLCEFFKCDCVINCSVSILASCKRCMSCNQNNWLFKRIDTFVSIHYNASSIAFVILLNLFGG